jgi:DNA-binding transcriptional LysR family regulator
MAWAGCGGCSMIRCSSERPKGSFRPRAPENWLYRSRTFSPGCAASSRAPSPSRRPDRRAVSLSARPTTLRQRSCHRFSPRCAAPGIDISVRHSLPQTALADLDARAADLAIAPLDNIPARFAERTLYEEDLVIAARVGHPFLAAPTLDRYCAMLHLVASLTGDARAYVDEALGE